MSQNSKTTINASRWSNAHPNVCTSIRQLYSWHPDMKLGTAYDELEPHVACIGGKRKSAVQQPVYVCTCAEKAMQTSWHAIARQTAAAATPIKRSNQAKMRGKLLPRTVTQNCKNKSQASVLC